MKNKKYSAQEVANHFEINNSTLVSVWMKKFLNSGFDRLFSKKGLPSMNKNKRELNIENQKRYMP